MGWIYRCILNVVRIDGTHELTITANLSTCDLVGKIKMAPFSCHRGMCHEFGLESRCPASPAFPLLSFCLEIFQKHLFRETPIPEYYQAAFLDLTFWAFLKFQRFRGGTVPTSYSQINLNSENVFQVSHNKFTNLYNPFCSNACTA